MPFFFEYIKKESDIEKTINDTEFEQYNFDLLIPNPETTTWFLNRENFINLSLSIKNNLIQSCYEGEAFTLGISENTCKKNGINYYKSNEEYPIRSSSFSSGIGLGINHHTVGWGTKKSFQYGFSSYIIKYKTILSSKFNSVSENEKIIRPQNEFWLDNKFYANYRYLKKP